MSLFQNLFNFVVERYLFAKYLWTKISIFVQLLIFFYIWVCNVYWNEIATKILLPSTSQSIKCWQSTYSNATSVQNEGMFTYFWKKIIIVIVNMVVEWVDSNVLLWRVISNLLSFHFMCLFVTSCPIFMCCNQIRHFQFGVNVMGSGWNYQLIKWGEFVYGVTYFR